MLDQLLDAFRSRDRRALSRLLTFVSRGEHIESILKRLPTPAENCRTVAFTGAAGVGKSTLIGKLIEHLRRQNLSVAILACDPQSPISGGSLLGDRLRMPSNPDDAVFIRSLSAAPDRGAIADHLPAQVKLLQAFGFDVVIIETVGAGQSDTAVRSVADVVVLLVQPESGDDVQSEKAGLLEVADVIAINKADLPGVDRTEADLRRSLEFVTGKQVPIVRVSGKSGEGIAELWDKVAQISLPSTTAAIQPRALLRIAQDQLSDRLRLRLSQGDSELVDFFKRWQNQSSDQERAAAELLQILAGNGLAEPDA